MTLLILVILAVMWTVVLLPPWLRGRREGRPGDSITHFRRQLNVLQHSGRATGAARSLPSPHLSVVRAPTPGTPAMPMGRPRPSSGISLIEAHRRRRLIMLGLGAFAVVTLLAAVKVGGAMIAVHLIVDVLLAGYVATLLRNQRLRAERRAKLRYLPQVDRSIESVYVLRSGT